MSGYGGYLTNFTPNTVRVDLDVLGTQHWLVKSIVQKENGIFLLQAANTITYYGKTIRIRVGGLIGNNQLSIESYGGGALMLKNGINEWIAPKSANQYFVFKAQDKSITNIEIEILPEYPGALVFDGVDDYVSLDAFDSGFKTVFINCNIIRNYGMLYDHAVPRLMLSGNIGTIAYNEQSPGGITYINGKLNNSYNCPSLVGKNIGIAHIFKLNLSDNIIPILGSDQLLKLFVQFRIYKFLGFKEALTEDQIQYVIKKYNLLDGVDEIEVS